MTAPQEPLKLTLEEGLSLAKKYMVAYLEESSWPDELREKWPEDLDADYRTLFERPVVARDDAAELREAAADAAALLKRIDHWEGSVILADEVWATSDGMPKLTRELYDQWIELQDERNRVRAALAATEGEEA